MELVAIILLAFTLLPRLVFLREFLPAPDAWSNIWKRAIPSIVKYVLFPIILIVAGHISATLSYKKNISIDRKLESSDNRTQIEKVKKLVEIGAYGVALEEYRKLGVINKEDQPENYVDAELLTAEIYLISDWRVAKVSVENIWDVNVSHDDPMALADMHFTLATILQGLSKHLNDEEYLEYIVKTFESLTAAKPIYLELNNSDKLGQVKSHMSDAAISFFHASKRKVDDLRVIEACSIMLAQLDQDEFAFALLQWEMGRQYLSMSNYANAQENILLAISSLESALEVFDAIPYPAEFASASADLVRAYWRLYETKHDEEVLRELAGICEVALSNIDAQTSPKAFKAIYGVYDVAREKLSLIAKSLSPRIVEYDDILQTDLEIAPRMAYPTHQMDPNKSLWGLPLINTFAENAERQNDSSVNNLELPIIMQSPASRIAEQQYAPKADTAIAPRMVSPTHQIDPNVARSGLPPIDTLAENTRDRIDSTAVHLRSSLSEDLVEYATGQMDSSHFYLRLSGQVDKTKNLLKVLIHLESPYQIFDMDRFPATYIYVQAVGGYARGRLNEIRRDSLYATVEFRNQIPPRSDSSGMSLRQSGSFDRPQRPIN